MTKSNMEIVSYKLISFTPPNDHFLFINVMTKSGVSGWGEITGSGNDTSTLAYAKENLDSILGVDALHMETCMKSSTTSLRNLPEKFHRCMITAWSGVNQALWDIKSKSQNEPLYKTFGGASNTSLRLYANLNRGLLSDRTPSSFASNANDALKDGFAFAKATPFDEVSPGCTDKSIIKNGMDRLKAIYSVADTTDIAVDCHWRFNVNLAHHFIETQLKHGPLYWIEDLLDLTVSHQEIGLFYQTYKEIEWAAGENLINNDDTIELIKGPARPDVFMPDIKHIVGIKDLQKLFLQARSLGCSLSAHNPSGVISTAFSAHLCAAVEIDEPLEYPYRAVPDRQIMSLPIEPIENGVYYLSDKPGIGISPSQLALEKFATILVEVQL